MTRRTGKCQPGWAKGEASSPFGASGKGSDATDRLVLGVQQVVVETFCLLLLLDGRSLDRAARGALGYAASTGVGEDRLDDEESGQESDKNGRLNPIGNAIHGAAPRYDSRLSEPL